MTNVQKIVESNSHEAHSIYPNLIDQQQFIKSMKIRIILLLRLKKEN